MKNFDKVLVGGIYTTENGHEYVIIPNHMRKDWMKNYANVAYTPDSIAGNWAYPRWIDVQDDGKTSSGSFDLVKRVGHYDFAHSTKHYIAASDKINIKIVETEREFTTENFRGRITNRRGKTYVNFDRNDQFDYENLGFELKDFQELMAMLLEINDCVEE